MNKLINIVLLLVFNVGKCLSIVGFICFLIWECLFCNFVRVKVVVYMNSINIIVFYDFEYFFNNKVFYFWNIWVIVELFFVGDDLIRMLFGRMIIGKFV